MNKKYIGYYIAGNFYSYSIYEITDAKGQKIYNAIPVGQGATRVADNLPDLYYQLENDVRMLNYIARQESHKVRRR